MTEKLEVKLFTQSFREAGGRNEFPDLKSVGIISTDLDKHFNKKGAIERLNVELAQIAEEKDCTHIFKIKYLPNPVEPIRAVGDVYRKKV